MACGMALLVLLSLLAGSEAAQILGLFSHPGKSHFDFFQPMFVALAERGHNISMYSYFPLKEPVANYTDYVFEGMPLLTDFVDLQVGFDNLQRATKTFIIYCDLGLFLKTNSFYLFAKTIKFKDIRQQEAPRNYVLKITSSNLEPSC